MLNSDCQVVPLLGIKTQYQEVPLHLQPLLPGQDEATVGALPFRQRSLQLLQRGRRTPVPQALPVQGVAQNIPGST